MDGGQTVTTVEGGVAVLATAVVTEGPAAARAGEAAGVAEWCGCGIGHCCLINLVAQRPVEYRLPQIPLHRLTIRSGLQPPQDVGFDIDLGEGRTVGIEGDVAVDIGNCRCGGRLGCESLWP